jgi:hypothetical protein
MVCPVCSGAMKPTFQSRVLGKYEAHYEACGQCGFLRAIDPHWLSEAYTSAIAAADTGLVVRNMSLAFKMAGVLYWVLQERGQGRYLDAAGGYGMLTRLMRDLGFDFYWSDKYCDNLLAKGFEYEQIQAPCTAVTAMEVMEHLTDPVAFVEDTLRSAQSQTLIFSTELYSGKPPPPGTWWYYAFETGQHIGFFQRRTLETLGEKLGLRFSSANGVHILSKAPINEQALQWATNRWTARVAPWWIRRQLGSKTMTDHELMLKSVR